MTRKEAEMKLRSETCFIEREIKNSLDAFETLGLIKFDKPENVWWISNKGFYTLFNHDYNPNSGSGPGLVWFKLDKKPFDRP